MRARRGESGVGASRGSNGSELPFEESQKLYIPRQRWSSPLFSSGGELSADGHLWLGQSQRPSIPWLGTGRPRGGGREAREPLLFSVDTKLHSRTLSLRPRIITSECQNNIIKYIINTKLINHGTRKKIKKSLSIIHIESVQ